MVKSPAGRSRPRAAKIAHVEGLELRLVPGDRSGDLIEGVAELMGDHALELVAAARIEEPLSDHDGRGLLIAPRREGVQRRAKTDEVGPRQCRERRDVQP